MDTRESTHNNVDLPIKAVMHSNKTKNHIALHRCSLSMIPNILIAPTHVRDLINIFPSVTSQWPLANGPPVGKQQTLHTPALLCDAYPQTLPNFVISCHPYCNLYHSMAYWQNAE
eukprot:scaffold112355_cov18-Prasinocladus_malaysianus.AAC.1